MHELFLDIQRVAGRDSPLHGLDARAKLLASFIIIGFAVSTRDIMSLLLLEFFVLLLMAVSCLPLRYVCKRLLLVLPFGGFIAIFQPFLLHGTVIWSFNSFHITQEGVVFGTTLFLRLLVSISTVLFLSSTTPQEELFHSLKRLKVPPIFISLLDMMIRYLGQSFDNLHRMLNAQRARGFKWRKNHAGYIFVLRSAGNTLGILFAKSMERGERVYDSMLARGYKPETAYSYDENRRIRRGDWCLVVSVVFLVVFLSLQNDIWQAIGLS